MLMHGNFELVMHEAMKLLMETPKSFVFDKFVFVLPFFHYGVKVQIWQLVFGALSKCQIFNLNYICIS